MLEKKCQSWFFFEKMQILRSKHKNDKGLQNEIGSFWITTIGCTNLRAITNLRDHHTSTRGSCPKSSASPFLAQQALWRSFLHTGVSLPSQDTPPCTQDRPTPEIKGKQKWNFLQRVLFPDTCNRWDAVHGSRRWEERPPQGKPDTQALSLWSRFCSQPTATTSCGSLTALFPLWHIVPSSPFLSWFLWFLFAAGILLPCSP